MTALAPGGVAAQIDVPVQTRSERPWSRNPADFPRPDRHDPLWRFLDPDRVAELVGAASSESALPIVPELPVGVETRAWSAGNPASPMTLRPEDVVAARALASGDGLELRITARTRLDEPIVLPVVGSSQCSSTNLRIVLDAGAAATVVLPHSGPAMLRENVELLVGEGASLDLIALHEWDEGAVHLASHQAVVERGGTLKHVLVSLGGTVVRVNPSVRLAGDGASATLLGLSFADDDQHLESQVFLHHEGPRTVGDVDYRSALRGERSRTVWVGDVLIGQDAVGTDTYEQNRNLVLTPGARADSIPNLEIATGDIVGAGHASATGRFDEEHLFYLQARGIPEEEARRLVVLGFLAGVIQRIGDAELERRLIEAVAVELQQERP